jgi:hypothetical protein
MPWAPARSVWNQGVFNSVYMNDDLTLPAHPLNPTTVFSGPDKQLNTADDVHPFNNIMQQQTRLGLNGVPILPTPDAIIVDQPGPAYCYFGDSDSLVITMEVMNDGDADLLAPFYISTYRDMTDPVMSVDSCLTNFNPSWVNSLST